MGANWGIPSQRLTSAGEMLFVVRMVENDPGEELNSATRISLCNLPDESAAHQGNRIVGCGRRSELFGRNEGGGRVGTKNCGCGLRVSLAQGTYRVRASSIADR